MTNFQCVRNANFELTQSVRISGTCGPHLRLCRRNRLILFSFCKAPLALTSEYLSTITWNYFAHICTFALFSFSIWIRTCQAKDDTNALFQPLYLLSLLANTTHNLIQMCMDHSGQHENMLQVPIGLIQCLIHLRIFSNARKNDSGGVRTFIRQNNMDQPVGRKA